MAGDARLQSLWTVGRALAVGLLALVSAPPGPAGAVDSYGVATQDGWWNRLQGPAEAEPEGNPVRPLAPPLPKPPTVPADAIAAGATAGQVDKVAAVGVDLALAEGATVDGLVLRLEESSAPGANVGSDGAKVVACPATAPWGPAQNAAWMDRPPADCSLGSAEGARGDDGTWTFDLAAIGRMWADPFAPLPRHGVVLSVDPAASPNAQVSWLDFDSGKVAVELTATPASPPAVDSAPDTARPQVAAAGAPAPLAPDPPADRPPAAGGALPVGPPARPAPVATVSPALPATAGPGAPEVPAAPAESPAEVAPPAASEGQAPLHGARPAVDFWARLPGSTVLLVPVVLGLAVVVGVALGPAGRPAPVSRREGGLSRALARRSAAAGAGSEASTAAR